MFPVITARPCHSGEHVAAPHPAASNAFRKRPLPTSTMPSATVGEPMSMEPPVGPCHSGAHSAAPHPEEGNA